MIDKDAIYNIKEMPTIDIWMLLKISPWNKNSRDLVVLQSGQEIWNKYSNKQTWGTNKDAPNFI
jgi:hypothetical protein